MDSEALPVAILAGGLATRLRPITEKIPKALIEVGGRAFLEHQIELLSRNSIKDVILCVGYLGEMIERRYGDGEVLRVRMKYSYDGPKLLGTGGAIKKALRLLPDAFFVLYGDSYLPVDYHAVTAAFREARRPALMTVFENADTWDISNVWFQDGCIRLYSKREKLPQMRHIDYGLMICRRQIFDDYPDNVPFDLAEVLENLSRNGKLGGYEMHQRFYEIGSPSGLAGLDLLLSKTSNY